MSNSFATQAGSLSDPARDAAPVTPDDGADLPAPTRALYVGSAGQLRVVMVSGSTVERADVQAGGVYPLRVRRVLATGTTAGGLIALR